MIHDPALSPSFSWDNKDIYTQETFKELKDRAYEKNSPYYVFVQIETETNPQASFFYDGISWRLSSQKDPLYRGKIVKVQYFAVKTFTIMRGNTVKADEDSIVLFPPRIYYSTILNDERLERICFSAVNFFAVNPDSLADIKKIRGILKDYLTARAVKLKESSLYTPDQVSLYTHLLQEILLWKVSEEKTLVEKITL
ncbi:hypothetical protein [Criblamydia sequanensis]|uniref:Uncharacterized protein n=1 Tax=Candidatus Criblamydia sequanensis CRIB-18 TaxID=1437425 RepID=A0A090D254_9BACT|nr:hypothetical protein [Criblamydia sequanensis]CDR34330.1 hypothetical protein CSEC_1516 [Criblamydia sequanensis CRIB-18]